MDPSSQISSAGGQFQAPQRWMGPSGTPLPPGMAPPPPHPQGAWLPIPPPPPHHQGPPFLMPMPPPGMQPFMPPSPLLQPPGGFFPLGAVPPPPPAITPPKPAAAAAALPPAAQPAPAANPKQAKLTHSQSSASLPTPRARQSVQNSSKAYENGPTSLPTTPTASSLSSVASTPTAPPSTVRRQPSRSLFTDGVNRTNGTGLHARNDSLQYNVGALPSRPQSGASSRSPKRISSAGPQRTGSARPMSARSTRSTMSLGTFRSTGGTFSGLDDSDNIKVAVRIRPLNTVEASRGDSVILQINPDEPRQVQLTVPFNPTGAPSSSLWMNAAGAQPPTTKTFQFHSCIGPEANQDDVMQLCGITQLLDAALDGYNATILAYGQTGSGKTYTISGRDDDGCFPGGDLYSGANHDDGVVSRSLAYIFAQIEARNNALEAPEPPSPAANGDPSATPKTPSAAPVSDGCRYSVRTSYSEIYNEALYDLLCFDQRQLSLRWDPVRGFHAPDLTLADCPRLSDAQEVVSKGLRHRRVGSHALNLESSRSHSILTVHIDAVPVRPEAADYGSTRMGKVVFVDLAGSERLKDSQSEGAAMKETASINRSLFMLGKVISTLATGAKGAVVPYRESKLTKLLMDSLGGSALSLMIACCSPSAVHLEETLSTLSYATRAKNIKNAPAVQMDPQQAALAALKRELKLLRTKNAFLREQLALVSSSNGGASAAVALPPPPVSGDSTSSPAPLPAHSLMLPVPTPAQEELSRRLADSQRLLNTLAGENTRLAAENERLRAGGLQVAGDYSGAVEEVEWLKSKLAKLEATLMGAVGSNSSAAGSAQSAEARAAKEESEAHLPSAVSIEKEEAPSAGVSEDAVKEGEKEKVPSSEGKVSEVKEESVLERALKTPLPGSSIDAEG